MRMYQPDSIAAFTTGNWKSYLDSVNENDARDYEAYNEKARVKDLTLDPTAFPMPKCCRPASAWAGSRPPPLLATLTATVTPT